jgi:DNA-binding NarL/FixJ family response regulator
MEDSMAKIMVVDDAQFMRARLKKLLLGHGYEVVEASDGLEAITAYRDLGPDIVLMDVRMPNLNGVEATRRLTESDPSARVIILTTFDDDAYVFDGLRAGALGYLLKDVSGSELADAIRTVVGGGALIEPSVARKVVKAFARLSPRRRSTEPVLAEPLSEREREVLRLLAQGLSNREIADRLFLAEGTVKNYVSSILQKTGARDRTQAAILAKEWGII